MTQSVAILVQLFDSVGLGLGQTVSGVELIMMHPGHDPLQRYPETATEQPLESALPAVW
jgi:hypothetical protein